MSQEKNIPELLKADPGNLEFIEYAQTLRAQGNLREALSVCLAGLNASPWQHRGRLLLGRIFFELGYPLFAVREIRELSAALPGCQPLRALLEKFEPGGTAVDGKPAETLAERDFNLADLTEQGEGSGQS